MKNNHEVADMPEHAKLILEGELFNVYQWDQEMYDGSIAIFERLSRRDGVDVIAVTEDKKILIQHEEQPARKPFIAIPGGCADDAEENLEDCARRELLEESGYAPATVEVWFSVSPFQKISAIDNIFIMRGCKKVAEPQLDAGEKIRVEEVSFDEFCDVVLRDDFRTKTVSFRIAKMLAQNKKEELRALLLG
jgi:ADP-ribose pyrophosphatase